EATKFEVKIRVKEKEAFRPGMSVTAEIETRTHANVLAVPFASVTVRAPKPKDKKADSKIAATDPASTNSVSAKTNATPAKTDVLAASTNAPAADGTNTATADKKSKDASKTIEVVFVVEGERVKMVPI